MALLDTREMKRRIRLLNRLHQNISANFLYLAANHFKWFDLSNTCVLDIGCSQEFNAVFVFLLPHYGSIIGIDNDLNFIAYLNGYRVTNHRNITYYPGDVRYWNTVKRWENTFSKLTSFYCLNCLDDKKAALQNMYRMLKPGGEAIILTGLYDPNYEVLLHLTSKEPWTQYQVYLTWYPEHELGYLNTDWYYSVLTEIGFEVLHLREFRTAPAGYHKETDFNSSEFTRDTMFLRFIPPEQRDEFQRQYQEYLRLLNRQNNLPELNLYTNSLEMMLRKKDEAGQLAADLEKLDIQG